MGFLVMAALGLMLREVQWLTCLLQLTQGPRSPHLQALHAVLKVLRAKGRGVGEENTKLRCPPGPAKLDWQACFMGFHHAFKMAKLIVVMFHLTNCRWLKLHVVRLGYVDTC